MSPFHLFKVQCPLFLRPYAGRNPSAGSVCNGRAGRVRSVFIPHGPGTPIMKVNKRVLAVILVAAALFMYASVIIKFS